MEGAYLFVILHRHTVQQGLAGLQQGWLWSPTSVQGCRANKQGSNNELTLRGGFKYAEMKTRLGLSSGPQRGHFRALPGERHQFVPSYPSSLDSLQR